MLAIRLQRLGRKGYPVYRIAVQEAQRHPSSGRIVAYVGSYNPHTKQVTLNKEKIELYLKNGAQPSPHVVKLLVQGKVSLPDWVNQQGKKNKKLRNPDKLRRNQAAKPAEEVTSPQDAEAEVSPGNSPAAPNEDEVVEKAEAPAEEETKKAQTAVDEKETKADEPAADDKESDTETPPEDSEKKA